MRAIAMLWTTAMTMAATSVAVAQADAPAPRPFVASYDVTYRGIGAGSLTFDFQRDVRSDTESDRYIFETRAKPSLLARLVVSPAAVERSVMEIGPEGVRPLEWRLDDGRSSDKDDGELQFDWAAGKVSGTIEREAVELPTEPRLQDRLSIQIAASTALLRGEEPGTIPLIDDNRVKRYTYTRKDTAVLDTPSGPLDTIIYESTRPGSSRVSRLWLAPKLDYAPARAEQIRDGKVETVMVLTDWKATEEP